MMLEKTSLLDIKQMLVSQWWNDVREKHHYLTSNICRFSLALYCHCLIFIYLMSSNDAFLLHRLVIVWPSFFWCLVMKFLSNIILSCHCLTIIYLMIRRPNLFWNICILLDLALWNLSHRCKMWIKRFYSWYFLWDA